MKHAYLNQTEMLMQLFMNGTPSDNSLNWILILSFEGVLLLQFTHILPIRIDSMDRVMPNQSLT